MITTFGVGFCSVSLEERQLHEVPCGNGHGFCLECLENLAEQYAEQGQFPCPLDRQPIRIPAAGVSSFPIYRSAASRHRARAVTVAPPTRPERRMEEDTILEWLQQIGDRNERRNISELIRQRARELEERDESFARQLQSQEYNNTGPESGPRPASRSTLLPAFRAAPRPPTARTRQQIGDDEQLAIRMQQEELLNSNRWATPARAPLPGNTQRQQESRQPSINQWAAPNHAHHAMGGAPDFRRSSTVLGVNTTAPFTLITVTPGGNVQVTTRDRPPRYLQPSDEMHLPPLCPPQRRPNHPEARETNPSGGLRLLTKVRHSPLPLSFFFSLPRLSVSVCLSVCLSDSLSVCLPVLSVSACLSVCVPVYPYPFLSPPPPPSLSLSLHSSFCLLPVSFVLALPLQPQLSF